MATILDAREKKQLELSQENIDLMETNNILKKLVSCAGFIVLYCWLYCIVKFIDCHFLINNYSEMSQYESLTGSFDFLAMNNVSSFLIPVLSFVNHS